MDTQRLRKEVERIRSHISTLEHDIRSMYDHLHEVEKKIMDKEEVDIDLWFDKIRQTAISKSI